MNPSISLRQMRCFVAVAEELSFRRAAERLHITQPPLSRSVAELEAALGLPLLLRDTRSVRLMPAGALALQEFRALLGACDAAVERLMANAGAPPALRLGVPGWVDLEGLGELERALARQGHASALETTALAGHEAVAAVRAGRLDAAVVAAPIELQGLAATTAATLSMAAFVPASSPLARRRRVSLAQLNEVPPFYRFRRSVNPPLYDHFARQYRAHGFTPREEAPAPEVMGVLAKIGAGRGCTCMPVPMAVHRYAGVVRRPLRERITLDIALVHPPALAAPLQALLLKSARRLFAATPGAEPV